MTGQKVATATAPPASHSHGAAVFTLAKRAHPSHAPHTVNAAAHHAATAVGPAAARAIAQHAKEAVAVAETFIGETWHRGGEAEAYGRALDRQWENAVEGERARELIVRAVHALPDPTE